MKKLFALILTVGLFASVANAQVPTYDSNNTILSSYIVSAGGTSNSVGAVIDCRRQQNMPLQWVATGIITNLISISVSTDGISYDTNHFVLLWTNATAPFVFQTNIPIQGFGWMRIDRVTDSGNRGSTNTVKYGIKALAP